MPTSNLYPEFGLSGRAMNLKSTCPSCKGSISIPEELFGRSFICPKCKAKLQSSSFDPDMIVAFTPTASPSVPPPIQPVGQQKRVASIARILSSLSPSHRNLVTPILFLSIAAVLSLGAILTLFSYHGVTPGDSASKHNPTNGNAIGGRKEKEANREIQEENGNGIALGFELFQSKPPEISLFTCCQSMRLTRRLLVGFSIYLEIRNHKNEAIESMSFILQDRTRGRTVPNYRIQIEGFVRGGIEAKSEEGINFLVPNETLGLGDLETHVSSDSVFEITLSEVRYANGDVLDLSKKMAFVEAMLTDPEEDQVEKERRKKALSFEVTQMIDSR